MNEFPEEVLEIAARPFPYHPRHRSKFQFIPLNYSVYAYGVAHFGGESDIVAEILVEVRCSHCDEQFAISDVIEFGGTLNGEGALQVWRVLKNHE